MIANPPEKQFEAYELSVWENEGGQVPHLPGVRIRPATKAWAAHLTMAEHPRDIYGDDLTQPREPVDDDEIGGEAGAA